MKVIKQRLKWLLGVCVIQTLFMFSIAADAQEHPLAWMECKDQNIYYPNRRYEEASAWYNELHRPKDRDNMNTTSRDFNYAYMDLLGVDPRVHDLSRESKRLYCESKKKFYEELLLEHRQFLEHIQDGARARALSREPSELERFADRESGGLINISRPIPTGPEGHSMGPAIPVFTVGGWTISIGTAGLVFWAVGEIVGFWGEEAVEITCADIHNDPEAYSRCLKKVREQLDMTEEEYIARKRQLPECKGCREE